MKVGYNIAYPLTLLVLGAGGLLLGLWLAALGGFSPMVFLGPIIIVLGVLQLSRPYFEYNPRTRSISVKALVGSMTRNFGGGDGGPLSVAGNRIVYTRPDGRTKRVPVTRAMAKRAEWDAVLAQLS